MANELIEEARKLAQSFRQRAEFYAERPSVDEQKKCPTMAEITRRECLEIAVADRAAAEAITRLCAAARAHEGWITDFENAPKGIHDPVLLSVQNRETNVAIVGEAYWETEKVHEGWWWANTDYGDYHDSRVEDACEVLAWQRMPSPTGASSPSARDVVPTDEPSELDIVQGALTLRIAQVQGLKEDNALLATVARRAESCLNTVKNDFAREKLESALAALPKRLRTRDDYPARPAPAQEGLARTQADIDRAKTFLSTYLTFGWDQLSWEFAQLRHAIDDVERARRASPAEGGGE